jgi:excinuclease ABC subunit B
MKFNLKAAFQLMGDQHQAVEKLVNAIKKGANHQTLLGVTGSGKTFTVANVIERLNIPTLVISHNKTLAGQLYQEFRDFFPDNAVSYFVSYYDFYQPEAYVPSSNTYIEKEAQINELIDKLRLQSTSNILSRKDALVISSVSCIYNIGRPEKYKENTVSVKLGMNIVRKELFKELALLQYSQSHFDFKRSTFRDRGENIDIYLSYVDLALRISIFAERVTGLALIDPLTGEVKRRVGEFTVYAAKHYVLGKDNISKAYAKIEQDLKTEVSAFEKDQKLVEADRLERRVKRDLEMIKEVGYVSGIENYSRYFDGRKIGEAPNTLIDYFNYSYGDNWLLIVDESHMTIPQIRGMYEGDKSRKANLVNYGFRLKAAYDNRPLKFDEFSKKVKQTVYVSATPADWEINVSTQVVEQLIRPTGIPDPKIYIKPVKNQLPDLIAEIEKRTAKKERVLVTTLTKRIAEDLTIYLKEKGIKASYLHSDVKTLERSDILDLLRGGSFSVLIGINLLREGLDLPEVTLVAILDADKEGFLRSKTALIQTMGRAARNVDGVVIIYTDKITKSIDGAIREVKRRRIKQIEYNKANNIVPKTIIKPIREKVIISDQEDLKYFFSAKSRGYRSKEMDEIIPSALTKYDKTKIIRNLRRQMKKEAENLNFEFAAIIRDKIKQLDNGVN